MRQLKPAEQQRFAAPKSLCSCGPGDHHTRALRCPLGRQPRIAKPAEAVPVDLVMFSASSRRWVLGGNEAISVSAPV